MGSSPKQPPSERRKDWYPYYAGFSRAFVLDALETHFAGARRVLDPWNGSGTTSAVCATRGIPSLGLDINPAATVIARARLTPVSVKDSLEPMAKEIALAAKRDSPTDREQEPLMCWMRRPAIEGIRRLQHAIHVVLAEDSALETDLVADPYPATTSFPILPSFYYAALFAATRDLLSRFRGSNPTWLRTPLSFRNRINPSSEEITSRFIDRVRYLSERLALPSESEGVSSDLVTGSVLEFSDPSAFDACLTSPPYATRLDYIKTTLAELAILGLSDHQVDSLRRATTGTPVVKGVKLPMSRLYSPFAAELVEQVKLHQAHGSSSYYAPWLSNYLGSLQESLRRISQAVTHDGRIGIVIQDSYYKAIHVDLQRIVSETMAELDRDLIHREDFPVSHSLASVNVAARKYVRNRVNTESLLVFS